jgi:hypothetical protein
VRDIEKGEELTITYSPGSSCTSVRMCLRSYIIPTAKEMDRRREMLAHSYGFDCQGGCEACAKPLDENTKQKIAIPIDFDKFDSMFKDY